MKLTRRGFIGGSASALPGFVWAGLPASAPALRIGVMTDTHVGKTVGSCERVRMALELFKEKGAELVINNGDIADHHYPTGYEAYRQVFEEVYAGGAKPREIYAYAWHDAFGYKGHPRGSEVEDAPEAFEDVRRLLRAPHGHTAEIRFKGYTFLVMPQFTGSKGFLSWAEYEEKVAAACRANPGKPVFVVDHVPPAATVYDSIKWGCRRTRQVLDRYPQVIDLSGHVHGSLRNDLFIWQGNFTVINSGCLNGWDGLYAGTYRGYDKKEFGVLTIDVCDDRLLVRRWDVRDRTEIDPEHPWIVPLPFVAATAPYRRETRRAREPRPVFAADTRVRAEVVVNKAFEGVRVTFADTAKGTMLYRITAARKDAAGGWTDCAMCECFSEYSLRPQDRKGELAYLLPEAYLAPSTGYRISVTPLNQYGDAGKPLFAEVQTPAYAVAPVVWSCAEPMKDLRFVTQSRVPKPYAVGADGFYGPLADGSSRLVLPEAPFRGAPGKYRLIVDLHTVCDRDDQQLTVKLAPKEGPTPWRAPAAFNGSGDVRSRRSLEFEIGADAKPFDLEIWAGHDAHIRFESLRIEKQG